ncbi:MAG: FAD-dependent oxidoreductase [Polyangia bacterium]
MRANSADDSFDIVIVGGGITGAALAYLATQAGPGLRVALLEAGTLACGTSSRSSRFLHGGLRYLAQGRVGLVRRLLRGRAELASLAPHLVRPAPFLLPLGPGTPHPDWLLRGALALYGALERQAPRAAGITAARRLDAAATRRAEPLLAGVPLTGALAYGELTVNDAALVQALARGAADAAAVVRTHVRCEGLLRDGERVVGVMARDRPVGDLVRLRARVVIDATGPWAGQWQKASTPKAGGLGRPRLARGTHLVLPASALPLRHTLVFFGPDRRALFASPRGQHVIVGTTDVDHHGSPDAVIPTSAEVAYLRGALWAALPDAAARCSGVPVSAFAGVRALAARNRTASRGTVTSALDRDYVVSWDRPGLLAVRGGKLTLALDGARSALRAIDRARVPLGLPPLAVPAAGRLPPLPALTPSSPIGVSASGGRVPAEAVRPSLTWRAA